MAIVCGICKKEVEIIVFGRGFVGVCCDTVFYNSEDKPPYYMEQNEEEDTSMHLFPQKEVSYQAKHS